MFTYNSAFGRCFILAAAGLLTAATQGLSVGLGPDVNGYPQFFAIGPDDGIYLGIFINGAWQPWTRIQDFKARDVVAIADQRNFPELYAIGLDHQVARLHFNGRDHWTRIPLPGDFHARALSVVKVDKGRPDVFVIGKDRRVFERRRYEGERWGPWQIIAPDEAKALSVATDGKGIPHVFIIGRDDEIHETIADGQRGTWRPWVTLGLGNKVKGVSATTDANGFPVAFAIGLDDQIWMNSLNDNGTWGQWSLVGGMKVKSVTAGKDPKGSARLAAVGQDDRVYMLGLDASGNWGSWVPIETGPIKK